MASAEYMRKWRANHPGYDAALNRKYSRGNTAIHRRDRASYKRNHPDRFKAQHKLRNAVFTGKIKSLHCTRCGLVCNPEGHHPDYAKPLEVIWLCRPCHSKSIRIESEMS